MVFFSWQSDSPSDVARVPLQQALEGAVARLSGRADLIARPELDHDTKGVPGAPPIVAAILEKLDACSVLVSDVSLTYQRRGDGPTRHAPNPNVLLETGYALRRLGHQRVLLLMHEDLGGPESLPFDLRGSRVIPYSAGDPARLETVLHDALEAVLTHAGPPPDLLAPATLRMKKHNGVREQNLHMYELVVDATNEGETILSPWSAELTFPQAMLLPNHNYNTVRSVADGRVVVMRMTEGMMGSAFYPGEQKTLFRVHYRMTHELYDTRQVLFKTPVTATLYHGTQLVAKREMLVRDLQEF